MIRTTPPSARYDREVDHMIRRRRQTLVFWFAFWDILLTSLSWPAAYFVRFSSGWIPLTTAAPEFGQCLETLPLVAILALFSFAVTGMYQVGRLRRQREELYAVVKGVGLLLLLLLATIFWRRDPYESRAALAIFFALTFASTLTARRLSWTAIRRLRRRGFNQTPALIVGTGRLARRTARALQKASWTGMYAFGFVDDQRSRWNSDLPVVGRTDELPQIIETHGIRHVFIALPLKRYHEVRRVFALLSQTLADVRFVADVPDLAGLTLTTTVLEGLPVIGLRESPHFGINKFIKRTMDVVLASIALVLLSPIMLAIALLIKLTSKGPVFYRQERCGLDGRPFQMLKFRSMRVDAEAQSGAVWAQANDPRRTWFGAFLRRTSLDELPQLINVLLGDMSLVGPRPERPVFIDRFRKSVPNYMARHAVKAGITGWAQVNGWRGNTSLRQRVAHDLYYIAHWNPWFDVRIMWLTLFRGLFHRNAY